jgi:hypothetical protein
MKRPKRKAIPVMVKTIVLERQNWVCHGCSKPLIGAIEFDHRPALIAREVNHRRNVYIPDQLDSNYINALCRPCHLFRSIGRKAGAEKTVHTKGSDIWWAKKIRKLESPKKDKRRILSRPFSKRQRGFR